MSSNSKKIIAVTGATGLQGGSVVRFLLEDGTFSVRALTRNPDSSAAKGNADVLALEIVPASEELTPGLELATQGAEVVQADLRDLVSIEKALQGAYGVYGVTNYHEPGVGADGERAQGKALVDAAKSVGIQHFVWSTVDRTEFKPEHWASKADVDDHLKASGIPRTSLYTAFYFENFLRLPELTFKKSPDGSYNFPMPFVTDAPFIVYSAEQTGAWALAAFKDPEEWVGKDMRIASEFLSARQITNTVAEVTGKKVNVREISAEEFETFRDNPIRWEIHENMKGLFHYGKPPFRDTELTRRLYPGTKTFRTWVEEHAAEIVP